MMSELFIQTRSFLKLYLHWQSFSHSITTRSIKVSNIYGLIVTLRIKILFATLTITILCRNAECHHAECRHAECRHAECRYAECRHA
jgi:hypothetical protein